VIPFNTVKDVALTVLNEALYHEDMREWRYSSTILDLGIR
jgi:hypothetical protein